MIKLKSHDEYSITPAQIRAARALIRWTAKDLAEAAKVGQATIARAEADSAKTIPTILRSIRQSLETAGVEFLAENGSGVGVRLRADATEADKK